MNLREDLKIDEEIRVIYDFILKIEYLILNIFV